MAKYSPGTPVTERPEKPKHVKDFPLWPHPLGYWVRKIDGRVERFGRWAHVRNGQLVYLPYKDGWRDALAEHNARFDKNSGKLRDEKPKAGALTLAVLCYEYCKDLEERVTAKAKKVTRGYFLDQKAACERLIKTLGGNTTIEELGPAEFRKLAKVLQHRYGDNRYTAEVTRIKVIFKWAFDEEKIDKFPRYGSKFRGSTQTELEKERAKNPVKLFTPEEIRQFIELADPVMRVAVLLGINAGLGNKDIADLERSKIDFKDGWLVYPRGKTGAKRRIPLWPETIAAIEAVWADRPEPARPENADIILLTNRGERLVRWKGDTRIDAVMARFRLILDKLEIKRKGVGFYSLRHSLGTYGNVGDRDAVMYITGHKHGDVYARHYDHSRPSDERLRAVSNHVRHVILGAQAAEGGAE